MKFLRLLILPAIFVFSCGESKSNDTAETTNGIHKMVVKDVLHVSEYSYLRVDENGTEKWLAAPLGQVEIDKTYYYEDAMEMKNFESKELGRTFETIYFVNGIRTTENADSKVPSMSQPANPHSTTAEAQNQGRPAVEKKAVAIEGDENTISIAELFGNREQYNNKTVRIKGEVTKYNPAIMNTNWVHLQDGTDFNGEYDLTVTTSEEVVVGDVVIMEGVVVLDKDFGAGYYYATMVEEGKVIR